MSKKKENVDPKVTAAVYKDAFQPATKEFGKAIKPAGKILGDASLTILRTADVLLIGPFKFAVWGIETLKERFIPIVEMKLKDVPNEQRVEPDPIVVGPALQAVRFVNRHNELQDLFANLIATSIDANTAINAHPAFVEIIKQLSPDEAKILAYVAKSKFAPQPLINIQLLQNDGNGHTRCVNNISLFPQKAGCKHPALVPAAIENLCRLGLFEIPVFERLLSDDHYKEIEEQKDFQEYLKGIEERTKRKVRLEKAVLNVSGLGVQFINSCVIDKSGGQDVGQ